MPQVLTTNCFLSQTNQRYFSKTTHLNFFSELHIIMSLFPQIDLYPVVYKCIYTYLCHLPFFHLRKRPMYWTPFPSFNNNPQGIIKRYLAVIFFWNSNREKGIELGTNNIAAFTSCDFFPKYHPKCVRNASEVFQSYLNFIQNASQIIHAFK